MAITDTTRYNYNILKYTYVRTICCVLFTEITMNNNVKC